MYIFKFKRLRTVILHYRFYLCLCINNISIILRMILLIYYGCWAATMRPRLIYSKYNFITLVKNGTIFSSSIIYNIISMSATCSLRKGL